ncbi:hypothetical protein EVAR_45908_1 [Eumeta japonica]|uniref:Uncharacterized protein n=1 Tax=Eumeta variegata TaxID=151549 RepID=A0A4C1XUU7_EUMVA|nr:hypothetical protein EVAR_45908_1 [Eumeta japonica]
MNSWSDHRKFRKKLFDGTQRQVEERYAQLYRKKEESCYSNRHFRKKDTATAESVIKLLYQSRRSKNPRARPQILPGDLSLGIMNEAFFPGPIMGMRLKTPPGHNGRPGAAPPAPIAADILTILAAESLSLPAIYFQQSDKGVCGGGARGARRRAEGGRTSARAAPTCPVFLRA